MNRAEKTKATEEIKESFTKAKGVFVADYRGLTVAEMTSLRFELKKSSTDFKVIKNRLALRALDGGAEGFRKHFDNTTAVALTYGDVAAAAKSLTKFSSDNDKLKIRGGLVEGRVVSLADVKALSKLPSRKELLTKLLGTWVAVPTGFVRVLHAVPAKLVYALDAVRRQKQEKGG